MKQVLIRVHQLLGTALSILFVMWFLTGFVMIYHNFPKMQESVQRHALYSLKAIPRDSLEVNLKTLVPQVKPDSLSLRMFSNSVYGFSYSLGGKTTLYPSEGKPRDRYTLKEVDLYAKRAFSAPIIYVDTLHYLDRWIPYEKHLEQMPILRYHYGDESRTELYVSQVTGEGVQYSTESSRFYAWIGAIPHWLYILDLRFYRDTWANIVITVSGLGAFMCLSGLILGGMAYIKRYRKRKDFRSMYPKGVFRWHHVTGFIFGVFVFSFSFSGMMSLQKIPQWLVSTHRPELSTLSQDKSIQIAPSDYPLSIGQLLSQLSSKDVLKVSFRSYGEKPYYQVLTADTTIFVDASEAQAKPLKLDSIDVKRWVDALHPQEKYTIILLKEYDNYYINKKQNLPLPVFHVQVEDKDKTSYYIDPKTASVRYFNRNTRLRRWTYQALHSFTFKGLVGHGIGWNILMFTAMIGGTIVSCTGLVLAWRYLRKRKTR